LNTTCLYYFPTRRSFDLEDLTTFFDLDKDGIEFVINLNYLGTLLPTQVFVKDMIGRKDANIINISSMNAFIPSTKIPAYSGAKRSEEHTSELQSGYDIVC